MKIKMKSKKMRGVMSAAALLLALTLPPAAHGQSDGFFSNAGGVRDGGNGGSWNSVNGSGNGGSWNNVNGGGNGGSWNDVNGGGNGGSWNDVNGDGGGDGASWHGMEDETPLGGGLLVLALSGVCYAGAKVKRLESKE